MKLRIVSAAEISTNGFRLTAEPYVDPTHHIDAEIRKAEAALRTTQKRLDTLRRQREQILSRRT
jgi:hypothetical protein